MGLWKIVFPTQVVEREEKLLTNGRFIPTAYFTYELHLNQSCWCNNAWIIITISWYNITVGQSQGTFFCSENLVTFSVQDLLLEGSELSAAGSCFQWQVSNKPTILRPAPAQQTHKLATTWWTYTSGFGRDQNKKTVNIWLKIALCPETRSKRNANLSGGCATVC